MTSHPASAQRDDALNAVAKPAREAPSDAPAASLWERLSRIGAAADDPPQERRRMRVTNQSAALGVANIGFFAAGYAIFGFFDLALIALSSAIACGAALFLQARGLRRVAAPCVLLPPNVIVLAAGLRFGPEVGFQYYFVVFATVAFLLGKNTPMRWGLAGVAIALLMVVEVVGPQTMTVVVPHVVRRALALFSGTSSMALVAYLVNVFRSDADETERLLGIEHARSERLLLNILPRAIAERLKGDERNIADGFPEVTILFADLVGFTELSQRTSPAALVELLNRIFFAFDALSDRHALEKIKTIGDSYMVAGGLAPGDADHAVRVVQFGLDMLAALDAINRETGNQLELRVGINSGPVVAGVIGSRKFCYDLWGDTVNTASRMESSGVKGRVQVAQRTHELAAGRLAFEARGKIQVKGKGEMETYLVAARA
jgi:class 3 adenylate cyclase